MEQKSTVQPKFGPIELRLAFLCGILFLDTVGVGLIVPVMPQLIREIAPDRVDSAAAISGYLISTFALVSFFCAPLLGAASDWFGRRPVLLASLLGFAADYMVMALSHSLTMLFLARVLSGVFAATIATVAAAITDISSTENRARSFGLMGMAIGLGYIFGPVIGGAVGEFGPRWPFIVAAGLSVTAFLVGLAYMDETLAPGQRRAFSWGKANPFGAIFDTVKRGPVVLIFLSVFAIQIANQSFNSVWPFYTVAVAGWTTLQIGLSIGVYGLMLVLVQGVLTGPFVRRFGEINATYFSLVAGLIAFIGLAFAGGGHQIYLWIVVGGLSGFSYPAMQSLMTARTPEDAQGVLQGGIASLGSVATVIGPLAMSHVFLVFTRPNQPSFPGAPFVISAALLLISIWLFSAFVARARTRAI